MSASSQILTEVGTNELEVVEFSVDGRSYAINVAKVREIVRPQKIMAIPESHPCMAGVFRNREDVLPLIDLGRWLEAASAADPATAKVIVTEFNRMKVGFLVHSVSRIHRLSWSALETPQEGSMIASRSALGFLRLGGFEGAERIVFLLDFEGIVAELNRGTNGHGAVDDPSAERRRGKVILVAEDSGLIRKIMRQRLEAGGFTVLETTNGEEAWQRLDGGSAVDLLISDIEMPRMDGHHLTKRVKSDARFSGLPVVLYSSMIHDDMRRKGETLGVDAQICKPDLERLVHTADQLVFRAAV